MDVECTDYFIYIHSIGFSGFYSKSKNGQYIIAWRDGISLSTSKDVNEEIDTEGIDVFIRVIENAIVENGSPEWKDKFLKAVERKIYEVRDADWDDEFLKIVDEELDESINAKWRKIFADALLKNIDEVFSVTLQEIDESSDAELEAEVKISVELGEIDDDIETYWKNWQKGEIVFLKEEKVIYKGEIERPNLGKVSNNGVFVINNSMAGEGRQATFLAFTSSGKRIVQHLFSANMSCIGLADNGQYAVVQLAHSDTADSSTMALFDLESGELLWQKIPETWVASSFEFDNNNNVLYLVYEGNRKFKYSLEGDFFDKEKWFQDRINHGTGFDLIKLAEGLLSSTKNRKSKGRLRRLYISTHWP